MTIYRLLQGSILEPDEIRRMCNAYELALQKLQIVDRYDPLTDGVAKAIIAAAQVGEKDPHTICELALANLSAIERRAC